MPTNNQKQSPNLLNQNNYRSDFVTRSHHKIVSASKIMIIAVEAAFVLALGLNAGADTEIAALQSKVQELETKIISQVRIEKEAKELIEKTSKYKTETESRILLSNRVDFIFTTIPGEITIKGMKLSDEDTSLTVEADDALSFSLLIARFFESGLIEQVTLNSARLNTTSETYVVELEMEFK